MKSYSRALLICVFCLLLAGASRCRAQAGSGPDEIWVAIRVADRGTGQIGSEYYGAVDKKAFLSMVTAPIANGFLKLSHVAWLLDGKVTPLSDMSSNGVSFGYGNVLYLRTDTILRIVELSDSFVKQNALKPK